MGLLRLWTCIQLLETYTRKVKEENRTWNPSHFKNVLLSQYHVLSEHMLKKRSFNHNPEHIENVAKWLRHQSEYHIIWSKPKSTFAFLLLPAFSFTLTKSQYEHHICGALVTQISRMGDNNSNNGDGNRGRGGSRGGHSRGGRGGPPRNGSMGRGGDGGGRGGEF